MPRRACLSPPGEHAVRARPAVPLRLAGSLLPAAPQPWCHHAPFARHPAPSQVAPSRVAGQGVFAVVSIPAGTVIGSYPGRPRTPAEMAAKCALAPGARDYAFK